MTGVINALQDWAQAAADRLCDLSVHPEGDVATKPRLVAHRGAWGGDKVENTLPAFQRALEVGAWAIELDVRFTKDGVPVINHDPDLGRLHRSDGRIEDLKFAELHSRAPMVPTLESVLALPAHFMIELKIAATDEQVQTLAQRLAHLSPKKDYHILSLRGDFYRDHSALPSEAWILVGELNMTGTYREAMARNFGGVAGHYVTLTRDLIERLHGDKLVAGTGFAPSKNIFRREWNRGVDWVFTNRIADLV